MQCVGRLILLITGKGSPEFDAVPWEMLQSLKKNRMRAGIY